MGSPSLAAFLFSMLLFMAPIPAQNLAQNRVHLWDGSIEYTGRLSVGKGTGFLSQAFPSSVVRGLDGLSMISYVVQDQERKTVEPWDLKICPLDAKGKPDYKRGVAIIQSMRMIPGNGIGASWVTHQRNNSQNGPILLSRLKDAKNQTLLDPDESFHFAWHILKAANWTSDGLSVHYSQAGTALPSGGFGQLTCWNSRFHREIPRPEQFRASDPTLQIIERLGWAQGSGQTDPSYQNMSWRLDLGFVEPTIQGAAWNPTYNNSPCQNPNEGYAALDPDFQNTFKAFIKRLDNYRWKLEAGAGYGGGQGLLFFSESVLSRPFKMGGIQGRLSLDPGGVLFSLGAFPIALGSQGAGSLTLDFGKDHSLLRQSLIRFPAIHAQALVLKAGKTPRLSSMWALRPLIQPSGFFRGVTKAGTPLSLTKAASRTRFYLRNDGPGAVRIATYVGSTRVGPVTRVPERCAVDVLLPSRAARIQVETNKADPVDVVYK